MAAYLPTLCAAPSAFLLSASPRSRQTTSISATARRNPARPVKATTSADQEATMDSGTKLSAWTSVRQERWEGELAVEGRLPDWLVLLPLTPLLLNPIIRLVRVLTRNAAADLPSGTYLRNGPGLWDVGGRAFHHLFDGYATLVRVSFRRDLATGAHRQTEMPLRYSVRSLLKSELAPASGSYMHVMCRSTGKTVASVKVPPFMAIHCINAYEEKGEDGRAAAVIVDCCEHYGDPANVEALVLHRLRSLRDKDVLPNTRVGRFRIPLDGSPFGELETALDPEEHGRGMDMCSINPAYLGKRYRYAYACGARRPCNFPNTLTKVDLVEKTAKNWFIAKFSSARPSFISVVRRRRAVLLHASSAVRSSSARRRPHVVLLRASSVVRSSSARRRPQAVLLHVPSAV
ncbi:Carotenoid cleavage dioxygenase 8-like protein A, chloroplastic [Dichanthelium oligosanthes]|uniref:Carotenoid cleavage dioxygenase 8-like protein A, chloroplastic n=1 Tax=Dichanthelium oligosanthes TaxID=888268 RepID=A0A1E5W345_9POAL|nr:Carotenoid cleavage dioxygenase 8-like protein A, chloroplastic [Dichanthelium oligosanthes]